MSANIALTSAILELIVIVIVLSVMRIVVASVFWTIVNVYSDTVVFAMFFARVASTELSPIKSTSRVDATVANWVIATKRVALLLKAVLFPLIVAVASPTLVVLEVTLLVFSLALYKARRIAFSALALVLHSEM